MKIKTKAAGITFRIKDNPEVGTLKPTGEVTLVPDPTNKYDDKAIIIMWEGHNIGFIPAKISLDGDEPQKWIHEQWAKGVTLEAKVLSYKYYDEEEKFNDEQVGQLQMVEIEIDNGIDNDHYIHEGRKYIRITHLLNYLNPEGSMDGLLKWACGKGDYAKYRRALDKAAENGTRLHKRAEDTLMGKDNFEPVVNFMKKYQPKVLQIEQPVYNAFNTQFEGRGIAGTPDLICKIGNTIVVVDWKSGYIRKKHELQGSFYAHVAGADETWIVSFRTKNKCKFAVKKLDKEQIDKNYKIVTQLHNLVKEL